MPDLAQGYSANIVLNAGDSVRVSTTGQATVTSAYGAPAGTTTLTANTQTFGSYQVPAKLRLTAVSGSCNYAQPVQVPVTVDQSTGAVNPPGAVSGAGDVTVNNRDGAGRVTSYAEGGVTFTVTYTAAGNVNTVSGGGRITTYSYDASGQLTGSTTV